MRMPLVLAVLAFTGLAATGCGDSNVHAAPTEPDSPLAHHRGAALASASGDLITEPGGVDLMPLARGSFPHPVDAKFKFRHGQAVQVVHVRNASDAIVAKLTIAEGGSAGWHRHPGTAIINVVEGTFGVVEETDCVLRIYKPGDVVFHRGQGILDLGFNAGTGDVVAYVTFLGIPPGQGATIPEHEEAPC